MTIYTIYRVEIELDSDTYERIYQSRKDQEFDRDFLAACAGTAASGSNAYADVTLWAETPDRAQACRCDAELIALVAKWQAWAKLPREEWHESH